MAKVKEKLYEHRCGMCIFILFMAYSFFISGNMGIWKVGSLTYAMHAVDFSVGFCTKLLPGAICNFLFDNITEEKVSAYLNILVLCCFFIISFLLEKVFLKVESRYRYAVVIMCAFFLTGPAAFSTYIKMFCMLDFYWLISAVLTILFLSRKQLYPLIIPAFIFALMSHNGTMICYIPFLVVFILYKISCTENKKESVYLWCIAVIAVAVTVGLFIYFLIYEYDNVRYTIEEFHNLLTSRGVTEFEYYDTSFYLQAGLETFHDIYDGELDSQYINAAETENVAFFFDLLLKRILAHFQLDSLGGNIVHFILVIPVVVFIYRVLVLQFKRQECNKLMKFSCLCSMMLFPVTIILSTFFSTDRLRWLSHAFVPLTSFLFYVIYKDDGYVIKEMYRTINKIPLEPLIVYFALYMLTTGAL